MAASSSQADYDRYRAGWENKNRNKKVIVGYLDSSEGKKKLKLKYVRPHTTIGGSVSRLRQTFQRK